MPIVFPNTSLTNPAGETWRITSSFTGDNNFMGANSMTNWERQDDVGAGTPYSGNILNESNGVFTFNELGWYYISMMCTFYHSQRTRHHQMYCYLSWNNGANWDINMIATGGITDANSGMSGNQNKGCFAATILNIPSNSGSGCRKLRFGIDTENNGTITYGTSTEQHTGFSVIKIADV